MQSPSVVKTSTAIVVILLLVLVGAGYFSAEYRALHDYRSMRMGGEVDFQIIDRFIHSTDKSGPEYYEALNLAATLDDEYLDEVVTLYAKAEMILRRGSAERIMELLPSESLKINTAAGRMLATGDYVTEEPWRARRLLEYSALRGDRDAAVYLTRLYDRFNCEVEKATWAMVANERKQLAVCDQIPVNVQRFSDYEWGLVVSNEATIHKALAAGILPELKYSEGCALNTNKDTNPASFLRKP